MLTDNPVLDAGGLKASIAKVAADGPLTLLYFDSCESTNIECLKLAEHNTVVIAEHQTAGRGRRGKNWHSPSSQNIYCSIGLNKSIKAEYLGLISLQVGVCIVKVLQAMGIDEVSLKWPNDVLLQGRKLGGILIETRATTQNNFYLVIGFGLNINLHTSDLKHIDQPAIGLNQQSSKLLDRQELLSALIGRILQDVMEFDLHMIDSLIANFNQFDELQGKQVRVKTAGGEITGVHLGIQRTGHIQVQTSRGLKSFSSAEISLRSL